MRAFWQLSMPHFKSYPWVSAAAAKGGSSCFFTPAVAVAVSVAVVVAVMDSGSSQVVVAVVVVAIVVVAAIAALRLRRMSQPPPAVSVLPHGRARPAGIKTNRAGGD
jgi:hypothetical protein